MSYFVILITFRLDATYLRSRKKSSPPDLQFVLGKSTFPHKSPSEVAMPNAKAKTQSQKTADGLPVSIVKVGGYIEFRASEELDKAIDDLVNSGNYNLIVDLKDVDYISSRGWSIFLSKIKILRENKGDLKLVNMQPEVYEVYKVLEFFWFLKVYNSVESAIEDFDKQIPPMPT
jgi:anti-anti-sigma factor